MQGIDEIVAVVDREIADRRDEYAVLERAREALTGGNRRPGRPPKRSSDKQQEGASA